jgi:hypothetical protein
LRFTAALIEMVLEAGYSGTTCFRKVVKVTVMVKKREGMSDFDVEHYNNQHAQIAAPVLLKHKVISYSLLGQFSCLKASLVILLERKYHDLFCMDEACSW